MAIPYELPSSWVRYDQSAIFNVLVDALSSISALKAIPYRRDWLDALQAIQLKMEVAGTSQLEGAEFSGQELDEALTSDSVDNFTRSQRQAKAALHTYKWIAATQDDRPIDLEFVREVHRRIVTGCDDDHCEPGGIRRSGDNVTFGSPRHRGCEGGEICLDALGRLLSALKDEFRKHDPLVQAMALHYHFAAMHPFQDGNGRTARALEALVLQRAGLRDTAFMAMSNYYYEEKSQYLASLSSVRQKKHDLTEFLVFSLKGVHIQCSRLLAEVKKEIEKAVFRNTMHDLFNRLASPRKRVIAKRQLEILEILLEEDSVLISDLAHRLRQSYEDLRNPSRALQRDALRLHTLGAVWIDPWKVSIDLGWPSKISESDFLAWSKALPRPKTAPFDEQERERSTE